ncbi:MAG: hypothetical protein Ct9H300mP22_6720 [Gammaproteobacteria bacterium]|nr:MAG: hypothetical protein Ct9H300mP22_6720 [Gammaproteobacteria bacterium]
MKIRKETAADIEAVFEINRSAFPTEEEAQLEIDYEKLLRH